MSNAVRAFPSFIPMKEPADREPVVFFKTIPPVDPVMVVKKICHDAMNEPMRKRTRFVKRLSPVTLMARASEEGLMKVAGEVLAPHFHQEPIQPQKVSHSEAHSPKRDLGSYRVYRQCNYCIRLAA